MERTGNVEKPPVAPKPRVLPPPKTILPASKQALDLDVSYPVKNTVKPAVAPKPCSSKTSAPPPESKSVASDSEHQESLQQKSDVLKHVGLLNSRNGPSSEFRQPEWDYVIPTCDCAEGKCHGCSPKENSRRPIQHGNRIEPRQNNKPEGSKSPTPRAQTKPLHKTTTNHGQGLINPPKDSVQGSSVANGSVALDKHLTKKTQGSLGSSYEAPATVTGSGQAVLNKKPHGYSTGRQNGSSYSGMTPVRKAPPLPPVQNKPKISSAGRLDNADIFSEEGATEATLTAVKLMQSSPVVSLKERPPTIPPRENKPKKVYVETQGDNVVPRWRTPAKEKIQGKDIHHGGLPGHALKTQQSRDDREGPDSKPKTVMTKEVHKKPEGNIIMSEEEVIESNISPVKMDPPLPAKGKSRGKANQNSGKQEPNSTPDKRPGTSLKPKAKSFSPADSLLKKSSYQKVMELDLPVKKTKKKQAHGSPVVKSEDSVKEDRQNSNTQNEANIQIPEYRRHLVREQSVDGEDFQEKIKHEHLYQNISDILDSHSSGKAATQTQQPQGIQQRQLSTENLYEEPISPEESEYFNESNVYEDILSSDEEEIDSGSEVEEDSNSYSDKDQSQNDAKNTKLAHIAREIMSSEKVFVEVLKLLHIKFRKAVEDASQGGKAVIDDRILNQILFSLPQLYELNSNLLRELEERVANWNEHSGVADIFLKKGPYLKMYSSYICEFDKNVALLEEQCRKNPAFAKVVREFESSPCCANLAVKHYMLKPVQRLPQYQLLLSDYVKNLNENSPHYKDTQDALKLVKDVANHANETMRKGDNFQKLIQVQYSLMGHHEIVKPGRTLLKEGTLMKLSRKVMQPRMFFLFNDTLLYTTPLQTGQYKLNNELSLAGMKVSKPSQEGHQNELNIESVERSFILSASSPTARDEWLEAISAAINDYTKKMISFGSSRSPEEGGKDTVDAQLGSKAPIWIPDLRATMCMICTCEFTLTWRRHHCRACGKVVCQACSTNKYPLEYLKYHPERVCDQCFETLQHNSSGSSILSPNAKTLGGFHFRRQRKIAAALKEVSANTDESSMSGYLERNKPKKKQWKRLWFVIKNKVLYTYAASEDVAALESLPLLGFSLKEDQSESSQQFKLYHKDKLIYIFKTDDSNIHHRWIEAFREAMVL
uniref:FYVE, RhoGEF and PH domain-containing protein 6-like n=1 Tax=Astyanax mexicanus TaxID=7994 RepID=W5L2W5_ASTMX